MTTTVTMVTPGTGWMGVVGSAPCRRMESDVVVGPGEG